MKKSTRILTILVAMLLVASLALTACDLLPADPTDPEHSCRHLCSTCDKCTDKSCADPVCEQKCQGHGSTGGGGDEHECESKCQTCDGCLNSDCKEDACKAKCEGHNAKDDDDDGGKTTPADITSAFNGAIFHQGVTTRGQLTLLQNGTGSLTISNPNSSFTGNFVDCSITYTITDGVFKIWTASDSNIVTPAVGTVQGRTVSITLQNSLNGSVTSYEFTSKLTKITLKNMSGKNETAVWYYPEGYHEDISATRNDGYTFDYALVNKVAKTESYLKTFTVPAEDVTVEYVWKLVEQTGNYTIIYQSTNDKGETETYTDHSTSNVYTLLSVFDVGEDEPSPLGFTIPEGKYFAGWIINGSVSASHKETIVLTEEETVVVAKWNANITVTLTGLHWSGVYSNLANNYWEGSYAEGFTQQFTSASNFFLPSESSQFTTVSYVARSSFILVGWQCSQHDEIHAPGTKHELTEDVTFEAKWQFDDGKTDFDGTYTATTPLDLSDYGFGPYVRATISNKTLTLYDEDGGTTQIQLSSAGNTGTSGLWTYTLKLEGDTLTISVTRGAVGQPMVGVFTRAN